MLYQQKIIIIMKQIIFVIVCLILSTNCGRILSGDVKVDYANAGSMTQLSFSFMLSNSITSTDYILIALPFPFHSELIPAFPATEGLSSPLGLLVTYQLMDNNNNLTPGTFFARALTDTIDSSNYFIQFYASDRKTIISVPANQWYQITMKIQTATPLTYQTSDSVLQIQMSTVSSVWPNAMVYDDNLAFNYFQLAATPSQLITVSATPFNFGTAGGYLLIQKVYSMYLDVVLNIPSYYYNQNLVLKFLVSKTNTFNFDSSCTSVAKTNAPRISILASTHFTCSIDTANNIMMVVLKPSALLIQQSFRFSVGMKNPAIIAQGVNIVVYAVQQSSPIILGFGSASGVLNTNQLYVTYQEIFLGWGLRPDALLPFDARIYRGNSATPTYIPYNSLSLKFAISSTTATTVELKIVIKIPSETSAFVLPSGFSTNLPAFTNKQVVCVTQFSTSSTNRQIGCTGVGSLTAGTVYYVGWKMFFPYDNYQSSVSCSQFGLLTIYTTTTITANSYAYYLGRGNSYLNYLKSSSDFVVIGRNSTYINYMTTFPSINLVVLSSDFQEFLSQPESLYMNNRPPNYSSQTFNNVYVISQNLAFLTYMSLFTDIYCAVLIPRNTDIVNGYDTLPLVATTAPKNTLTITTSNSNDWTDFVTDTLPLVSSTTAVNSNVPGSSLLVSALSQSLVFSFSALYSSVTSTSSTTATPITNNWGMLIMMNPSITLDTTPSLVLTQTSVSQLTPSVVSVTSATSYNQYTMITLRGSISDALQNSFKLTASKTRFGLYPFKIPTFSSIYADSGNLDFMIITFDGIDGPLNKMTPKGYFLINGFTQTPTTLGTIYYGFMNYQYGSPLDGSKIPTMLRLRGSITIPAGTVLDSLIVFFDSLTPFFSNQHAGEIYCYNSDNTLPCEYYKGTSVTTGFQLYNYQSLSRFQVTLNTPATAFNILIPVVHATNQGNTNIYIAYQIRNTTNGFKSLTYVQSRSLNTITASIATTSGTYGPVVSGATVTVGQSVTNLQINAKSSSGAVTANSNNNKQIGAGFSYFSQWDYFKTSTITGWSAFGQCTLLKYLFYFTNYASYLTGSTFSSNYKEMTGVVCNCDISGAITAAVLTLSVGYLPSKWGVLVPGSSGVSQNLGQLRYLADNSALIVGILPLTALTFPTTGPSMQLAVGQWLFTLPVALQSNVLIKISSQSLSINLPFTFSGTCAAYYLTDKISAGCNFITTPTTISYILTILQSGIVPTGAGFKIVHYGMLSNSITANVPVDVQCSSLLRSNTPTSQDRIFISTGLNFAYRPASYIGASSLMLGSFAQWSQDKAVTQDFSFSFSLISKGLYMTNRIRFNLGQFSLDNAASVLSPKCKVFTYNPAGSTAYSYDWAAVDSAGGFSSLQIWPARNLISNNLTYTIKCSNFISTSSPTPVSITAMVVNTSSDLTGELNQAAGISLPVLDIVSTTAQITLTKFFSIPSIGMEMNFNVASPGITLDSFLYLNFPSYYASGLGQDIKCYSPTGQIYCLVVDRFMTLQYIGVYAVGTSFTLTITGVTMAINYNSGTFSFIFDDDNNPTSVQATGTFTDTISSTVLSIQNFPTLNIFAFTQSSSYLRENAITISLTFYLPTSLSSIGLGQSLFLIFPATYFDVLRFVTPSCTLNILGNTLKNYVSTCSILGMRLKMPFLDNLVLGSTYTLSIGGFINPTNPTSNVYKYSLQITDSTGTSVIAKSYATNCNYNMPTFSNNLITNTLDYYLADGTKVTSINTMTNIQSDLVYISPTSTLATALYARNTYLSPLSSLQSNPSNINLLAGSNPFAIRLSSLTSGVNYLYFSKTGDGGYYSNLPPLILTTSKNYFTAASFLQTTFRLPVGIVGANYTLYVTLPTSLYPISQVSFVVTLSSNIGISLRYNPTTITFYPGKIVASVELYINDATLWVAAATTNLVFTPSGSTTYASGVSIALTAVAAPGIPALTFTQGTINLMNIDFSVRCSEEGKFIYHLYRSFPFNTTACYLNQTTINYWLGQSSLSSLRVSENYYKCKDIIAIKNIAANTTITINIPNLQAKTKYVVDGYCETQSGVQSAITTLSPQTLTNGGRYSVMSFTFNSKLTTAQKIKLVCSLALQFQIDYERVSTYDGYFCSQLLNRRRRLLMEQTSESPISYGRYLQTVTSTVAVYFGINTNSNTDSSQATILAQSNTTNLITSVNSNIVGLPTLISTTLNSIITQGSNDFSSTLKMSSGPNYFYISKATLTSSGLIYAIIGDNAVWPTDPLISQIITGSGPGGLSPVCFKIASYRASDANTGNIACTSLSGSGSYTLYVVASDDNPFDTANFGVIQKFRISNEVPSWQMYAKVAMMLMMLLALC